MKTAGQTNKIFIPPRWTDLWEIRETRERTRRERVEANERKQFDPMRNVLFYRKEPQFRGRGERGREQTEVQGDRGANDETSIRETAGLCMNNFLKAVRHPDENKNKMY